MAVPVDLEVQGSNDLKEVQISVREQPLPRIKNYGIVESLVSGRNDEKSCNKVTPMFGFSVKRLQSRKESQDPGN